MIIYNSIQILKFQFNIKYNMKYLFTRIDFKSSLFIQNLLMYFQLVEWVIVNGIIPGKINYSIAFIERRMCSSNILSLLILILQSLN